MTGTNGVASPTDAVLAQYNTDESAQFYSVIMGDGTAHVHYGVYTSPDDTVRQAVAATTTTLRDLAEGAGAVFRPGVRVLDLGAGNGGTAHALAAATGCSVTCLNLCEVQNAANEAAAAAEGLSSLITVVTGSFENLPADWSGSFDVVWSQDAIVHSSDKGRVWAEAARVLVPGGYVVISDIMAAPSAADEALRAFKKRLHVDELLTLDGYEAGLKEAGVSTLRTRDLSGHLLPNYRRMLGRITTERARLTQCSDAYLEQYAGLLRENIKVLCDGEAQAWSALVARKAGFAATSATASAVAPANGVAAAAPAATGPPAGAPVKRWVSSKIHGVRVTRKSVSYHGSVGISRSLLAAAGITEYEVVDVVNLTNGARWTTYALGIDEDASFSLNGGGARLGEMGDKCVIMAYTDSAVYTPARVAILGGGNVVIDEFAYEHQACGKAAAAAAAAEAEAVANGTAEP